MHKTLLKSLVRLIQQSMSRFLAVAAIVGIGVAFFTGVSGSADVMSVSVDEYSDALKLKDLTLYSNYGFDEDDVKAVSKTEGVAYAEGSKFTDAVAVFDNEAWVTRIHSLNHIHEINQFVLAEGRMPENEHEALGEKGSDLTPGFPLGAKVRITMPEGGANEDLLSDWFTITGIIDTPLYLNEVKENSTLSNQYIHSYLYVNEDVFNTDYYTEINVLTEKGESYNSFTEPYEKYSAKIRENLRTLALTQENARYTKLRNEALEEYGKGLSEYEKGLKEFKEKTADAEAELAEGEKEIASGEQLLSEGENELKEGIAEYERQRGEAYAELAEALALLKDSDAQLSVKKAEFEKTKAQLLANVNDLREGIAKLHEAKDGLSQIDEGLKQIEDAKEKLSGEKLQLMITLLKTLEPETPAEEVENVLVSLQDAKQRFEELFPETADLKISEIRERMDEAETSVRNDYENLRKEEYAALADDMRQTDPPLPLEEYEHDIPLELRELIARWNPLAQINDTASFAEAYDNALFYTEEAVSFLDSGLYEDLSAVIQKADEEETVDELLSFDPEEFKSLISLLEEETGTEIHTVGELLNAYQQLNDRLESTETQLLETRKAVTDMLKEQGIEEDGIDEAIAEYEALINTILDGIADGEVQLADAERQLAEGYSTYYASVNEADILLEEARMKIAQSQREIFDSQARLADAKAKLKQGYEDLEKAKADSLKELEDAKKLLEEGKAEIDAMAKGSWTVLDRKSHYASATYHQTIDQMRAIGDIFPLFFILVAALVCLTTMSRMISEQRSETGTLRALGYTRLQCAAKYLVYAALATLIGCVIGSIAGLESFPRIIYNAWRMMYILPPVVLRVPWKLVLMTSGMFLGAMLLTTWLVIRSDMREVPSQLMRPKAAANGRSTVLEKIGFVWNRLSFTWKVTMRNIFRYRRRFIMTVLGVAGCAALMVTGYGIRDSVNDMVTLQFDEILQFEGTASLSSKAQRSEIEDLKRRLSARADVASVGEASFYSAKAHAVHDEGLENTVTVEIFADEKDVEDVYVLRERTTHKPIALSSDGAVINERLAENLHLKTGDTFLMEDEEGVLREVKVSGICELYIYHYAFMSEEYYRSLCGKDCSSKGLFIHVSRDETDSKKLQNDLMEESAVSSISFYDETLNNFSSMVKSLDLIVWTLIFSSMALAFVVLGNLININVSERQREIATLKVLGFHRKEVQSYIFKENNILTIIGTLAGMPLGRMLHKYIMSCIEMDFVIFGRSIRPSSYVISALFTVAFGMITDRLMAKNLDAIAMVESLKSVE